MEAIEVSGLTKSFGRVRAVQDLTFSVEAGKVTGFLGPNGAGKSTTLRMVLGLVAPDEGEATILGRRFRDLGDPVREVGALLETQQFHPGRSGRNHLLVLAAAAGIDTGRVDEVLETVGLGDAATRRVGGYSLGMKQRLGLAGALLGDPKILVLDEPVNGLDPAGIRWMRGLLRSFVGGGRAVLVSSHLLSEVSEMADEVVVINNGQFVTHAPVSELLTKASPAVRVRTDQPERLRDELAQAGIEADLLSHDELLVPVDRETVGRIAAEAGIPIFGLENEIRKLEDVFFELTEQS